MTCYSALTIRQRGTGFVQMASRCSVERAVVTGARGSTTSRSRTLASRRSSIEDRRCGETNLELSLLKFWASASSEADRRTMRRSKPPRGSSRARGSESLSMLREVGHPRSSSHVQFLRLALGVHAKLVSLVRAFRRCDRRLHRCLSAPLERRVNHRDSSCIKTRSLRLVLISTWVGR